MVGIHKVYPDGTIALKGVDFDADFGEIHGLLGENGAGKTTLMRILYGELQPTKGEIYIEGRRARFRGPWEALESGLAMVHQHFTLVESFTVFENLMLIAKKDETPESLRRRVEELERELNLPIPLDATVEGLPVGVQQRVEIIKTLLREARILILDEPTSVLTPLETKELFALLKKLRDMGMCIIFISHKLKEVMEITDRVTVLRKGLKVDTVRTEDVDERTLATMMVGRELAGIGERNRTRPGEALLKVEDLWVLGDRGQWAVKGVSLEVRRGEILGLAGVEGNGQMELIEAITGLRRAHKGKVTLRGRDVTNASPRTLYRLGMAHIPSDRQNVGLILDFSVEENSILGIHWDPPFARRGVLDLSQVRRRGEEVVDKFGVVAPSPTAPVRYLSGGNQQKIIAGREILKGAEVFVASQPTRGLDVASTEYIRKLLLELRDQGKAILLVSTDLDEILQLSDRIAVMYEGKIIGELERGEATMEKLGLLMGGVA